MTTRRSIPLTAAFVRTVRRLGAYGEGPGGHGLVLRVKPRAGGGVRKHWAQRLRIGGKAVNIGLGAYPVVSLAQARDKALANRSVVAQGQNPRRKTATIPTVAQTEGKAPATIAQAAPCVELVKPAAVGGDGVGCARFYV